MINLLFTTSGIILTASFLFKEILLLRLVTTLGMFINATAGIAAGYDAAGMKPLIFFSIMAFAINCYQIAQILMNKRAASLSEDMREVYLNNFHEMTTKEFVKIYHLSFLKKMKKDEILTMQDQPVDDVMLIKNGRVNIIKDGQFLTTLESHFFIGEMSFLTNHLATATVRSESDDVQIIGWDKHKLAHLKKWDSDLYHKWENALALNLIKKINRGSPSTHEINTLNTI